MSDTLYTITEDSLDTGLRGLPVGTVRTSQVDPLQGVSYRGRPVASLATQSPEAVAHLLLYGVLPEPKALEGFCESLRARAVLDPQVVAALHALPRTGHPMAWLVSGLSTLGMVHASGDWREDALRAVAQAPTLIAAIYRLHAGWGAPIAPDPSLGLVEGFVQMLDAPGVDARRLTQLLRLFYVLHLDHGGGNLSTFVGKAVASAHTDIFLSLAAAMAGLYGPLHGRANQACLDLVRRVGSSDPVEVECFVRAELAAGRKISGFGHAVLRAEDPRATVQYALGERLFSDDPLFQTARVLRKVAVRVLSELPKVSNPHPNVDAVSGTLLHAAGLTDPSYYTLLFGLSRITGVAAQIVDERVYARAGRGVPIYRPKYIFRE